MLIRQLIRFLKNEYHRGTPSAFYTEEILKYYYEKHDKDEIKNRKNLLSQFNYNSYNRMSLHEDSDFEMYLLLWNINSHTKIRKNEDQTSVLVLEGNLFESKFGKGEKLVLKDSLDLSISDTSTILKDEYFSMNNADLGKSLSLHVRDNNQDISNVGEIYC